MKLRKLVVPDGAEQSRLTSKPAMHSVPLKSLCIGTQKESLSSPLSGSGAEEARPGVSAGARHCAEHCILWSEARRIAIHLDRNIGGEALRHDTKVEGSRGIRRPQKLMSRAS